MDKRSIPRIYRNFLAFTNVKSPEFFGVISNISKRGFFIESLKNISPGCEISLFISIQNELYKIKGEVRWTKNSNQYSNNRTLYRMGIKVTEAPADYLNYIEYLKYNNSIQNIDNNNSN